MLLLALTLLATTVAAERLMTARSSGCKCTANDPCWPSTSEWAALSANLTYPVFNIIPPGYYCHDPNYDGELCADARANADNPTWLANQPGAAMSSNLEFNSTSWCYINDNATNTCGQGRVPSVGVNTTSVQDLQAAVAFAAKYNLKVRVKNTGHDFLGRGLGPGSLMIWTHYWNGTTFSSDFVYAGGRSAGVPAITVSPGTQWYEAYQFASDNGVTIAGGVGANASVGAGGGWPMGAGHNILSPALDLGADNVIEVSVVLPNTTHVTANAYQNTDLFWAVRGGGGPSFGISTSLTYRVYPQFPVYAAFFEAYTNGSVAFVNLLDSFHSALPSLAQAGWSGYYPFSNGDYLALMYLLPNGTTTLASSTLGVWVNQAAQISGVTIKTNASTLYTNYEAWLYANILNPVDVVGFNYDAGSTFGLGAATASWLVPASVFTNATATNQLSQAMSKMNGIGQHVGGGVVASHPGDFNAIHPAWRDTLVDLVAYASWEEGTSQSDIQALRQNLTDAMAPVRALTPDNPAQYLNEPDLLIPNFTQANWGTNYRRLLFIKKEIDPDNMFLVLQGVNSEHWDSEQICPVTRT